MYHSLEADTKHVLSTHIVLLLFEHVSHNRRYWCRAKEWPEDTCWKNGENMLKKLTRME